MIYIGANSSRKLIINDLERIVYRYNDGNYRGGCTVYDEIIEKLIILDENVTKNYPDLQYEGTVNIDEDELDYVNITVRGVVIA